MTHESPSIPPLRAWILASRPRTLSLSLTPILAAFALAVRKTGSASWIVAGWSCVCLLWIQIGTNLINDALDFAKGADAAGRLGPGRMTQAGALPFHQVFAAGCLCFVVAFFSALPLIWMGGWPLAILLVAAIASGYFYTGGPFPLSYLGISDPFILVFFGWVGTGAVYYLLTGGLSIESLLAGTQLGCLAIAPHALNNLRDWEADARVCKRTLAVRFGWKAVRWEVTFVSLAPFAIGLLWIKFGAPLAAGLPWLCLPWAIRTAHATWQHEPSPFYNELLASSALCALSFGSLLALGLWYS